MTTIINSPKIPCRAKDPRTCKYHSAELRAADALKSGDIDAYLVAQAEMTAAIKTTPEVVEFFATQKNPRQAAEAAVERFYDNLNALHPDKQLQAAIDKTRTNDARNQRARLNYLDEIAKTPDPTSIQARFQKADLHRRSRIQDAYENRVPYLVGGTAEDVADTEFTAARLVYQRAANILNQHSKYRKADGFNGYVVPWNEFNREYKSMADEMMDEIQTDNIQPDADLQETQRTLDQVYKTLEGRFQNKAADGTRTTDLNRALRTLDLAFWNSPNGPPATR